MKVSAVQFTACSVQIKDTHIQVSAETRQPVTSPTRPDTVLWTNYTPPQDPVIITDPRLVAVHVVLLTLSAAC